MGSDAIRRPLPRKDAANRAGRPAPPMPPALRGWSPHHLALCAALLALCSALSAIVYRELMDETTVGIVASKAAPATTAAPGAGDTGFTLPPFETLAEVTARPLFSPSRRPAPPQLVQGRSVDAGSLVLSGVILTSDARVALVQQGKSTPAKRLSEGQEIDGWTVETILPDRIVLRRGATEQELKLHDDAQRARVVAPTPAGATASMN